MGSNRQLQPRKKKNNKKHGIKNVKSKKRRLNRTQKMQEFKVISTSRNYGTQKHKSPSTQLGGKAVVLDQQAEPTNIYKLKKKEHKVLGLHRLKEATGMDRLGFIGKEGVAKLKRIGMVKDSVKYNISKVESINAYFMKTALKYKERCIKLNKAFNKIDSKLIAPLLDMESGGLFSYGDRKSKVLNARKLERYLYRLANLRRCEDSNFLRRCNKKKYKKGVAMLKNLGVSIKAALSFKDKAKLAKIPKIDRHNSTLLQFFVCKIYLYRKYELLYNYYFNKICILSKRILTTSQFETFGSELNIQNTLYHTPINNNVYLSRDKNKNSGFLKHLDAFKIEFKSHISKHGLDKNAPTKYSTSLRKQHYNMLEEYDQFKMRITFVLSQILNISTEIDEFNEELYTKYAFCHVEDLLFNKTLIKKQFKDSKARSRFVDTLNELNIKLNRQIRPILGKVNLDISKDKIEKRRRFHQDSLILLQEIQQLINKGMMGKTHRQLKKDLLSAFVAPDNTEKVVDVIGNQEGYRCSSHTESLINLIITALSYNINSEEDAEDRPEGGPGGPDGGPGGGPGGEEGEGGDTGGEGGETGGEGGTKAVIKKRDGFTIVDLQDLGKDGMLTYEEINQIKLALRDIRSGLESLKDNAKNYNMDAINRIINALVRFHKYIIEINRNEFGADTRGLYSGTIYKRTDNEQSGSGYSDGNISNIDNGDNLYSAYNEFIDLGNDNSEWPNNIQFGGVGEGRPISPEDIPEPGSAYNVSKPRESLAPSANTKVRMSYNELKDMNGVLLELLQNPYWLEDLGKWEYIKYKLFSDKEKKASINNTYFEYIVKILDFGVINFDEDDPDGVTPLKFGLGTMFNSLPSFIERRFFRVMLPPGLKHASRKDTNVSAVSHDALYNMSFSNFNILDMTDGFQTGSGNVMYGDRFIDNHGHIHVSTKDKKVKSEKYIRDRQVFKLDSDDTAMGHQTYLIREKGKRKEIANNLKSIFEDSADVYTSAGAATYGQYVYIPPSFIEFAFYTKDELIELANLLTMGGSKQEIGKAADSNLMAGGQMYYTTKKSHVSPIKLELVKKIHDRYPYIAGFPTTIFKGSPSGGREQFTILDSIFIKLAAHNIIYSDNSDNIDNNSGANNASENSGEAGTETVTDSLRGYNSATITKLKTELNTFWNKMYNKKLNKKDTGPLSFVDAMMNIDNPTNQQPFKVITDIIDTMATNINQLALDNAATSPTPEPAPESAPAAAGETSGDAEGATKDKSSDNEGDIHAREKAEKIMGGVLYNYYIARSAKYLDVAIPVIDNNKIYNDGPVVDVAFIEPYLSKYYRSDMPTSALQLNELLGYFFGDRITRTIITKKNAPNSKKEITINTPTTTYITHKEYIQKIINLVEAYLYVTKVYDDIDDNTTFTKISSKFGLIEKEDEDEDEDEDEGTGEGEGEGTGESKGKNKNKIKNEASDRDNVSKLEDDMINFIIQVRNDTFKYSDLQYNIFTEVMKLYDESSRKDRGIVPDVVKTANAINTKTDKHIKDYPELMLRKLIFLTGSSRVVFAIKEIITQFNNMQKAQERHNMLIRSRDMSEDKRQDLIPPGESPFIKKILGIDSSSGVNPGYIGDLAQIIDHGAIAIIQYYRNKLNSLMLAPDIVRSNNPDKHLIKRVFDISLSKMLIYMKLTYIYNDWFKLSTRKHNSSITADTSNNDPPGVQLLNQICKLIPKELHDETSSTTSGEEPTPPEGGPIPPIPPTPIPPGGPSTDCPSANDITTISTALLESANKLTAAEMNEYKPTSTVSLHQNIQNLYSDYKAKLMAATNMLTTINDKCKPIPAHIARAKDQLDSNISHTSNTVNTFMTEYVANLITSATTVLGAKIEALNTAVDATLTPSTLEKIKEYISNISTAMEELIKEIITSDDIYNIFSNNVFKDVVILKVQLGVLDKKIKGAKELIQTSYINSVAGITTIVRAAITNLKKATSITINSVITEIQANEVVAAKKVLEIYTSVNTNFPDLVEIGLINEQIEKLNTEFRKHGAAGKLTALQGDISYVEGEANKLDPYIENPPTPPTPTDIDISPVAKNKLIENKTLLTNAVDVAKVVANANPQPTDENAITTANTALIFAAATQANKIAEAAVADVADFLTTLPAAPAAPVGTPPATTTLTDSLDELKTNANRAAAALNPIITEFGPTSTAATRDIGGDKILITAAIDATVSALTAVSNARKAAKTEAERLEAARLAAERAAAEQADRLAAEAKQQCNKNIAIITTFNTAYQALSNAVSAATTPITPDQKTKIQGLLKVVSDTKDRAAAAYTFVTSTVNNCTELTAEQNNIKQTYDTLQTNMGALIERANTLLGPVPGGGPPPKPDCPTTDEINAATNALTDATSAVNTATKDATPELSNNNIAGVGIKAIFSDNTGNPKNIYMGPKALNDALKKLEEAKLAANHIVTAYSECEPKPAGSKDALVALWAAIAAADTAYGLAIDKLKELHLAEIVAAKQNLATATAALDPITAENLPETNGVKNPEKLEKAIIAVTTATVDAELVANSTILEDNESVTANIVTLRDIIEVAKELVDKKTAILRGLGPEGKAAATKLEEEAAAREAARLAAEAEAKKQQCVEAIADITAAHGAFTAFIKSANNVPAAGDGDHPLKGPYNDVIDAVNAGHVILSDTATYANCYMNELTDAINKAHNAIIDNLDTNINTLSEAANAYIGSNGSGNIETYNKVYANMRQLYNTVYTRSSATNVTTRVYAIYKLKIHQALKQHLKDKIDALFKTLNETYNRVQKQANKRNQIPESCLKSDPDNALNITSEASRLGLIDACKKLKSPTDDNTTNLILTTDTGKIYSQSITYRDNSKTQQKYLVKYFKIESATDGSDRGANITRAKQQLKKEAELLLTNRKNPFVINYMFDSSGFDSFSSLNIIMENMDEPLYTVKAGVISSVLYNDNAPPKPENALAVTVQLLLGLHLLHKQNIVLNNISHKNIRLLSRPADNTGNFRVKFMDFSKAEKPKIAFIFDFDKTLNNKHTSGKTFNNDKLEFNDLYKRNANTNKSNIIKAMAEAGLIFINSQGHRDKLIKVFDNKKNDLILEESNRPFSLTETQIYGSYYDNDNDNDNDIGQNDNYAKSHIDYTLWTETKKEYNEAIIDRLVKDKGFGANDYVIFFDDIKENTLAATDINTNDKYNNPTILGVLIKDPTINPPTNPPTNSVNNDQEKYASVVAGIVDKLLDNISVIDGIARIDKTTDTILYKLAETAILHDDENQNIDKTNNIYTYKGNYNSYETYNIDSGIATIKKIAEPVEEVELDNDSTNLVVNTETDIIKIDNKFIKDKIALSNVLLQFITGNKNNMVNTDITFNNEEYVKNIVTNSTTGSANNTEARSYVSIFRDIFNTMITSKSINYTLNNIDKNLDLDNSSIANYTKVLNKYDGSFTEDEVSVFFEQKLQPKEDKSKPPPKEPTPSAASEEDINAAMTALDDAKLTLDKTIQNDDMSIILKIVEVNDFITKLNNAIEKSGYDPKHPGNIGDNMVNIYKTIALYMTQLNDAYIPAISNDDIIKDKIAQQSKLLNEPKSSGNNVTKPTSESSNTNGDILTQYIAMLTLAGPVLKITQPSDIKYPKLQQNKSTENDINYNIGLKNKPANIKNMGNICFADAALQLINVMSEVRDEFIDHKDTNIQNTNSKEINIKTTVGKLLYTINTPNTRLEAKMVHDILKYAMPQWTYGLQMDASEAYMSIMQALESNMPNIAGHNYKSIKLNNYYSYISTALVTHDNIQMLKEVLYKDGMLEYSYNNKHNQILKFSDDFNSYLDNYKLSIPGQNEGIFYPNAKLTIYTGKYLPILMKCITNPDGKGLDVNPSTTILKNLDKITIPVTKLEYKLVAAVYHIGAGKEGGHYVAAVLIRTGNIVIVDDLNYNPPIIDIDFKSFDDIAPFINSYKKNINVRPVMLLYQCVSKIPSTTERIDTINTILNNKALNIGTLKQYMLDNIPKLISDINMENSYNIMVGYIKNLPQPESVNKDDFNLHKQIALDLLKFIPVNDEPTVTTSGPQPSGLGGAPPSGAGGPLQTGSGPSPAGAGGTPPAEAGGPPPSGLGGPPPTGAGVGAGSTTAAKGIKIATSNLLSCVLGTTHMNNSVLSSLNYEPLKNPTKKNTSDTPTTTIIKTFLEKIVNADILLTQESSKVTRLENYTTKMSGEHDGGETVGLFVKNNNPQLTYGNDIFDNKSYVVKHPSAQNRPNHKCHTKRNAVGINLKHNVSDDISHDLKIANFHLCGGRYDDITHLANITKDNIIAKLYLLVETVEEKTPNILIGDFNSDVNMYKYISKNNITIINYIKSTICEKITYTDNKINIALVAVDVQAIHNSLNTLGNTEEFKNIFTVADKYCNKLKKKDAKTGAGLNVCKFESYILWNILPFIYLIDNKGYKLVSDYNMYNIDKLHTNRENMNTSYFNNAPDVILVTQDILDNYDIRDNTQYPTFKSHFVVNQPLTGFSDHDALSITLYPKQQPQGSNTGKKPKAQAPKPAANYVTTIAMNAFKAYENQEPMNDSFKLENNKLFKDAAKVDMSKIGNDYIVHWNKVKLKPTALSNIYKADKPMIQMLAELLTVTFKQISNVNYPYKSYRLPRSNHGSANFFRQLLFGYINIETFMYLQPKIFYDVITLDLTDTEKQKLTPDDIRKRIFAIVVSCQFQSAGRINEDSQNILGDNKQAAYNVLMSDNNELDNQLKNINNATSLSQVTDSNGNIKIYAYYGSVLYKIIMSSILNINNEDIPIQKFINYCAYAGSYYLPKLIKYTENSKVHNFLLMHSFVVGGHYYDHCRGSYTKFLDTNHANYYLETMFSNIKPLKPSSLFNSFIFGQYLTSKNIDITQSNPTHDLSDIFANFMQSIVITVLVNTLEFNNLSDKKCRGKPFNIQNGTEFHRFTNATTNLHINFVDLFSTVFNNTITTKSYKVNDYNGIEYNIDLDSVIKPDAIQELKTLAAAKTGNQVGGYEIVVKSKVFKAAEGTKRCVNDMKSDDFYNMGDDNKYLDNGVVLTNGANYMLQSGQGGTNLAITNIDPAFFKTTGTIVYHNNTLPNNYLKENFISGGKTYYAGSVFKKHVGDGIPKTKADSTTYAVKCVYHILSPVTKNYFNKSDIDISDIHNQHTTTAIKIIAKQYIYLLVNFIQKNKERYIHLVTTPGKLFAGLDTSDTALTGKTDDEKQQIIQFDKNSQNLTKAVLYWVVNKIKAQYNAQVAPGSSGSVDGLFWKRQNTLITIDCDTPGDDNTIYKALIYKDDTNNYMNKLFTDTLTDAFSKAASITQLDIQLGGNISSSNINNVGSSGLELIQLGGVGSKSNNPPTIAEIQTLLKIYIGKYKPTIINSICAIKPDYSNPCDIYVQLNTIVNNANGEIEKDNKLLPAIMYCVISKYYPDSSSSNLDPIGIPAQLFASIYNNIIKNKDTNDSLYKQYEKANNRPVNNESNA